MAGYKQELVTTLFVGDGYPIEVVRETETGVKFQVKSPEFTLNVCSVFSAGDSWMVNPRHGSEYSFHDEINKAFDKATELTTRRSIAMKRRRDTAGPAKEELDDYITAIKELTEAAASVQEEDAG